MKTDNRQINRDKLRDMLAKNSMATHVLMRREDEQLVDIPLVQADFTFMQHPGWILEGVASNQKLFVEKDTAPVVVPPKPSEEKKEEAPAQGVRVFVPGDKVFIAQAFEREDTHEKVDIHAEVVSNDGGVIKVKSSEYDMEEFTFKPEDLKLEEETAPAAPAPKPTRKPRTPKAK